MTAPKFKVGDRVRTNGKWVFVNLPAAEFVVTGVGRVTGDSSSFYYRGDPYGYGVVEVALDLVIPASVVSE